MTSTWNSEANQTRCSKVFLLWVHGPFEIVLIKTCYNRLFLVIIPPLQRKVCKLMDKFFSFSRLFSLKYICKFIFARDSFLTERITRSPLSIHIFLGVWFSSFSIKLWAYIWSCPYWGILCSPSIESKRLIKC